MLTSPHLAVRVAGPDAALSVTVTTPLLSTLTPFTSAMDHWTLSGTLIVPPYWSQTLVMSYSAVLSPLLGIVMLSDPEISKEVTIAESLTK